MKYAIALALCLISGSAAGETQTLDLAPTNCGPNEAVKSYMAYALKARPVYTATILNEVANGNDTYKSSRVTIYSGEDGWVLVVELPNGYSCPLLGGVEWKMTGEPT